MSDSVEKDVTHRLVRVEHDRCNEIEYEALTYVLAPAEWSTDEIDAKVEAAHAEYLSDWVKAKALPDQPKLPSFQPDFNGCDQSLSVAEVKARHAAEKAAYDEWEKACEPLRREFEEYLIKQGFVQIWEDATYRTTVYWGHAHGSLYRYGQTDLGKDIPSPLTRFTPPGSGDGL